VLCLLLNFNTRSPALFLATCCILQFAFLLSLASKSQQRAAQGAVANNFVVYLAEATIVGEESGEKKTLTPSQIHNSAPAVFLRMQPGKRNMKSDRQQAECCFLLLTIAGSNYYLILVALIPDSRSFF